MRCSAFRALYSQPQNCGQLPYATSVATDLEKREKTTKTPHEFVGSNTLDRKIQNKFNGFPQVQRSHESSGIRNSLYLAGYRGITCY